MQRMRIRPTLLAAIVLLCGGAAASARDTYTLASAQVVVAVGRPPFLRLSASGPIAFRVVPPEELGAAAVPHRLVAQLYGVSPGTQPMAGVAAPFSLALQSITDGLQLEVSVAGVPEGSRLDLRAGSRASEIEVVILAPQP